MSSDVADPADAVAVAPAADAGFLQRHGATIEYILIPGAALAGALVVFGIFVALFGKNPLDLYFYMYYGAFGTWFSWQNTLTRAAPLMLTALCTALPAQLPRPPALKNRYPTKMLPGGIPPGALGRV